MKHWYDDGYIVAIPVVFLFFVPMALVPIFRPEWADKIFMVFFIRITPGRGKVLGALMLLGVVRTLADIADHLIHKH